MYHNLRRTFGVTLCLLGLVSPLVFAAEPPSKPLSTAQLVAVEGASDTYRVIDYDHRVIKAAVPAQALTDVQMRNPDGTVQATVSSIDTTTGQIRASTDAGQVLVLVIPREDLGSMKGGDTFTLVVPQQPHHARVAGYRKLAQSR
jgi:hypothetical protein